MRHGKKINHLGRKSAHRKAMLSNMANSLIEHKRINTTVAKAKALRKFVEPIITKSKTDSTHSRRMVFSKLQSKNSVNILFREVAPKVANRPGGYTRIIRTGYRLGDNAEMCLIELVDFNELLLNGNNKTEKKATTRRSRGGGKKSSKAVEDATVVEEKTAPKETKKAEEKPKAEAKKEVKASTDEAAPKTKAEKPAEKKTESAPKETKPKAEAKAKKDEPKEKKEDKK